MKEEVRTGPLCWAQEWYWLIDHALIREGGGRQNSHAWIGVPAGVQPGVLRAAARQLVERHETLRTVYDAPATGFPSQIVYPAPEPEIAILPFTSEDPSERRESITAYRPPAGDTWTLSPFRLTAGTVEEDVRDILMTVDSIAVDGVGMAILRRELEDLLRCSVEKRAPELAAVRWHPVDHGRAEQAEKASGTSARNIRHWSRSLHRGAHVPLPFSWDDDLEAWPSYRTSLESRSLAAQCDAAASRYRVTVPSLLHAVLAVMIAEWVGEEECPVETVTANRWQGDLVGSVGRYASGTRVIINAKKDDVFASMARSTHAALLAAYAKSHFDLGEMAMEESRVSSARGARISSGVIVEYHDYLVDLHESDPAPGLGRPESAHGEEEVHQERISSRIPNVHVNFLPSRDALGIALSCSSRLLSPEQCVSFLRQFVSLVDAVAERGDLEVGDLSRITDLPRFWDRPTWTKVAGSWTDTELVQKLLLAHGQVADAAVFATSPGSRTNRIVAYVVPQRGGKLTLESLDDHMREQISHHPAAVLPATYRLCRNAPAHRGEASAWAVQEPVGWAELGLAGASQGAAAGERALAAAFRKHHPGAGVDQGRTYAQLGGRFTRIPMMLDSLEQDGFRGVSFDDFLGLAPLRRIASRMTACPLEGGPQS